MALLAEVKGFVEGVGLAGGRKGAAGSGEVEPVALSHQFLAFPSRRVVAFLLISIAINQPPANF